MLSVAHPSGRSLIGGSVAVSLAVLALSAPDASVAMDGGPPAAVGAAQSRLGPTIAGAGFPVPLATEVVSPTDVWAVGTHAHHHSSHASTIYASHWDGADWKVYPTPNPGLLNNKVRDIDAVSSTDIWAVG